MLYLIVFLGAGIGGALGHAIHSAHPARSAAASAGALFLGLGLFRSAGHLP